MTERQRNLACRCPKILAPICCDGTQYSNPCLAECAGVSRPAAEQDGCVVGECAVKQQEEDTGNLCACLTVYKPLCCNGKTYSNACSAECDGIKPPAHAQEECERGACTIIKQAL